MDALGPDRAACCPSSIALRGVEQNRFHHLDVHGHTLEVLEARDRARARPRRGASATSTARRVAALLAEPLADELTRGDALRFGALLHDAAKPRTRDFTPEGASRSSATTARARASRARC